MAAVTAANLAMAERVARAAQPTIVVEPKPPAVLNQPPEIPKPCARAPKVVATAMVEVAATVGRKDPQERLAHLGKSDHPVAEVPMQRAVQWIPLRWIPRSPFRVASCQEFLRVLFWMRGPIISMKPAQPMMRCTQRRNPKMQLNPARPRSAVAVAVAVVDDVIAPRASGPTPSRG